MPDFQPPPGLAVLGGHYRLTKKLGEGAFGEVYEAEHELLGQQFAVKVLKPELCESEEARSRFLDEARALIRFSHPNVVQLRHVGEHGGRLFLVMDFVRGETLGDLVLREGRFSEARALSVIQQVLAGLEAAHAAGIVHRDLKPSNLLVERTADGSDHVRILDFGLSKLTSAAGSANAHRSMTGTIVGTLAYMSPEQLQGERDIDKRSDVFATGLLLHEMLEGHHPYPGDSGIVVAAKLLRDPVPPLDPDLRVSASTRAAISTALERDRDARFASVTAFSQALAGKGPPSDTSRVTTVEHARKELARQEAAARARPGATPPRREESASARRRLPWAAVALGLVLVGGGAAYVATLDRDDPVDPAPRRVAATDPHAPLPSARGSEPEAAPEPVVRPEPRQPDPVQPEPPRPEPVKPDPVQPEPMPEPAPEPMPAPEPAPESIPEPTAEPGPGPMPEPAPEPAAEPAKPETEAPSTPKDPYAGLSPEACCDAASAAFSARRYDDARLLFTRVLDTADVARETHVGALRGLAGAWIADADASARRGDLARALALLEEARTSLAARLASYSGSATSVDAVRLEVGFSHLLLGEAQMESARWLAVAGRRDEGKEFLKPARDSFEFANTYLRGDGPRYAELVLRRATLERLEGRLAPYWSDLSEITQMDNEEVLKRSWVAQARGARLIAEAHGARGNASEAAQWAKRSRQVAQKGVSWKDKDLSREEWLELVRTLFVAGSWRSANEDPRELEGLANYWVKRATESPAAGGEDERIVRARLRTAEAVREYLAGLSAPFANRADQAAARFQAARAVATEAVSLREAAAKDGHELPDRYAYSVLAAIERALGRDEAASAALAAASAADAKNPD